MPTPDPRRWWALAVIALAQFIVIMDTSIIGVALPDIQRDLGFDQNSLSWVFNAYVIAFGGLLLLGGRLSDLFGARKMFATGWAVLLAGSVVAGLAETVWVELVGRAVQGTGAAFIAPAALTLLMMLFGAQPKELTKALALYGAAARRAAPPACSSAACSPTCSAGSGSSSSTSRSPSSPSAPPRPSCPARKASAERSTSPVR